jgi:hypothetical protein
MIPMKKTLKPLHKFLFISLLPLSPGNGLSSCEVVFNFHINSNPIQYLITGNFLVAILTVFISMLSIRVYPGIEDLENRESIEVRAIVYY